jgi:hypothetical protein
MFITRQGAALFVRFAILFLLACLVVLFSAAAIANHYSGHDDDDSSLSFQSQSLVA